MAEMLTRLFLDSRGHEQLSDMPLGVFCRMDKKSKNGRREFVSPHGTEIRQRQIVELSKCVDRRFDLPAKSIRKFQGRYGRARGQFFLPQIIQLHRVQHFIAGIREKPIEDAGEVLKMKSNRCDPVRTRPQTVLGKILHLGLHFLMCLKQSESDGLQKWRQIRKRAT